MKRVIRIEGSLVIWDISGEVDGKSFRWEGDQVHGVREFDFDGKVFGEYSDDEYMKVEGMIVKEFGNLMDL